MSMHTLHSVAPAEVVAPATPEELAETLREARARALGVVPWGGGTRQHLGPPPARYDLALSTARLDRIIAYEPADLVITVEAGATLAAIQAALARYGQWLPWDPPLPERASVGGLLASGAAGALRLGYNAPRDWTLGLRVALGDGRLVRSGGRVVKNVAGYDAHKLHIGALGTLGVIVEATFKVQPLPEHSQTLLAAFTDLHLPEQAMVALRAAPLQPIAVAALSHTAEAAMPTLHAFLEGQPTHIVVAARFAGGAAAVARQIREAAQRCVEVGARTVELREEDDGPLWAAIADFMAPSGDGSLFMRAAIPGQAITSVAGMLDLEARGRGWCPQLLGIAGPGLVFCRWSVADAEPACVAQSVAAVRQGVLNLGGYLVIEEAPPSLPIDRWGPAPEASAIMRALRASWDPMGVLNPGRYLI